MVGAPGAGKGTQAQLLASMLGSPHIASGDLFRAALQADTRLGREARGYMEKGALVPDDVTVRMIADRLRERDAAQGAILDGFPRTVPQAEALDRFLARSGGRVTAALYIHVSEEELVRRLSGRWICSGPEQHVFHESLRPPRVPGVCDLDGSALHQRADDQPKTIRARLEKQLPPMFEVIDHYAEQGRLVAVPGEQPVEEVTAALLTCIARTTAAPVA
ncbi:MAG: nucleoside monophosphate kinase [Candidatus Limnocylindrales bacterium]